ncbi:MAG: type II toxin-antitoxin system RelB/DinJ family antitoxin [Oscillospiraceae bacterium]|nr:type II toxin-antitoxin system RelB/DinJ family antitoxin [Oscillospiraceae bacterium]
MANTTAVYARIDTSLKDSAEEILAQLGISPSSAIQMLYSQIILQRGMPFESKLPVRKPVAIGSLNREQLDAEIKRGFDSANTGKVYSEEEVDRIFAEEFGI